MFGYQKKETLQQTACFHVNNILVLHKDGTVNSEFIRWAQENCGVLKMVKFKGGKGHEFLVTILDFGLKPGSDQAKQKDCVLYLIETFSEEYDCKIITHFSNELFQIWDGVLLSDQNCKVFTHA